MEEFRKGGRVKKQRKLLIKKKIKKKIKVKKPRVRVPKDKITSQRGFSMFGYAAPHTLAAPLKPTDEDVYSKISEAMRQTKEQQLKLEEQQKKAQDNMQVAVINQPAIIPDYDEIRKEQAKLKSGMERIYKYGGQFIEDVKGREAESKAQITYLKDEKENRRLARNEAQRQSRINKKKEIAADAFRERKLKEKAIEKVKHVGKKELMKKNVQESKDVVIRWDKDKALREIEPLRRSTRVVKPTSKIKQPERIKI